METFGTGQTVTFKKPHACGGSEFKIIRTGADFKAECLKCGRVVLLDREKFIKAIKKLPPKNCAPSMPD